MATTKFVAPKIPTNFPTWPVRCTMVAKSTGQQCKRKARPGDTRCQQHGSDGKRAQRAWKRFLVWVLLGDRPDGEMLPDAAVKIGTQVLARAMLAPEERHDKYLTVDDKIVAARYLLELEKTLNPRADVVPVIAEALGGDVELATEVAQALDHHGWLRTGI